MFLRDAILLGFLALFGLTGCVSESASKHRIIGKPGETVRSVDWNEAPALQHLAEHIRDVANSNYSSVVRVLTDSPADAPHRFDIVFKRTLPNRSGEKRFGTIQLNASLFKPEATNVPPGFADDLSNIDSILIHEMAHMAGDLWHPWLLGWTAAPRHWSEGLADYACFKLGFTNQWRCPECAAQFPHYLSGYHCAGAFLLFLDQNYGAKVVKDLNSELRGFSFSDAYFSKATGRTLPVLWTEFTNTPAFKPIAVQAYEYQSALGFRIGQTPHNLEARFRSLVLSKPGGALTLDALKFLHELRKAGSLPGFAAGEPLWMDHGERGRMPFARPKAESPEGFPATRWFYFYRYGDARAYQYIVRRQSAQAGWELTRWWVSDSPAVTSKQPAY